MCLNIYIIHSSLCLIADAKSAKHIMVINNISNRIIRVFSLSKSNNGKIITIKIAINNNCHLHTNKSSRSIIVYDFVLRFAKCLLYAVFISIRLLIFAILSKMSSNHFCQSCLSELSLANLIYKNSQLGLRSPELLFYKCLCQ
jgi:hypothetical protein